MNRVSQSDLGRALAHEEDITDRYERDLGGLITDVADANAQTEPYVSLIRSWMEENRLKPYTLSTVGLLDMTEWAATLMEDVQTALADGHVSAVDATRVITPQSFLAMEVASIAVGALSSRLPLQAQIVMSKSRVPCDIEPKTKDDVIQFIKERNKLGERESWPDAWMEFKVRECASRVPQALVLIDGPLMPHALITRPEGRALLHEMLDQRNKRYLAVIKDLRHSGAELRFFGRALRTGEAFVVTDVYTDDAPRMERYQSAELFKAFLGDIGAREIVRGVFKPGLKAFGFECRLADLAEMMTLLWVNRNGVAGFEIPFLLAQVDAHIRGRYRATDTTKVVMASMGDEFWDEADERTFR